MLHKCRLLKTIIDFKNSTTFLQGTVDRFKQNPKFQDPLFICNEEHRFIVAEQIRKINIKASAILLEPLGRNTAPAITVASLKAKEIFNDPIILVLPADHLIKDLDSFLKVIYEGINYAKNGKIVTFGITPDKPETGYGYIEAKNNLDSNNLKGEEIVRFIEKPSLEIAEKLITQNRFTWNSGIFLFKAEDMLKEIKIKEIQNVNSIFISSIFKKNKNYLGINKFKLISNLTKKKVIALGGVSKKNINKLKLLKNKEFAGISYFK